MGLIIHSASRRWLGDLILSGLEENIFLTLRPPPAHTPPPPPPYWRFLACSVFDDYHDFSIYPVNPSPHPLGSRHRFWHHNPVRFCWASELGDVSRRELRVINWSWVVMINTGGPEIQATIIPEILVVSCLAWSYSWSELTQKATGNMHHHTWLCPLIHTYINNLHTYIHVY